MKELMREIVVEEKENLSFRQRIWHFVKLYVCFIILTSLFQFAYIEIGHDRGWSHAEQWYTYIHK